MDTKPIGRNLPREFSFAASGLVHEARNMCGNFFVSGRYIEELHHAVRLTIVG